MAVEGVGCPVQESLALTLRGSLYRYLAIPPLGRCASESREHSIAHLAITDNRFTTTFPAQLESRLTPAAFAFFVEAINLHLGQASSTSGALMDNVIAVATLGTSSCWRTGHFEKVSANTDRTDEKALRRAEAVIGSANAATFNPKGLNVRSPRTASLQFVSTYRSQFLTPARNRVLLAISTRFEQSHISSITSVPLASPCHCTILSKASHTDEVSFLRIRTLL